LVAEANFFSAIMVLLTMQNKLIIDPKQDLILANEVAHALMDKGLSMATAESCTGGAIGALLTSLPGSSRWFNGGVISYSNHLKIHLLGVNSQTIDVQGAVSKEVVEAMAVGGCKAMAVDICVAVSGVAGPDGGTTEKPVGSVWIAWCGPEQKLTSRLYHLDGGRKEIQSAAVRMALKGVVNQC
jgi:nicotinamide-nucleotide amidase|tara:strand:+ start:1408 stop:1959 length:552 start_codon:yes stop_codon:yes gene_type:complete